ncbi:MAG: hypothetical protein HKN32_04775 [Flavobacteriales bacterium]|nr:hypothetical protein [Flavobacteriales bacterium]
MNPEVTPYFTNGCGRCPLAGTAKCKVNRWPKILSALRSIMLQSDLEEELKWGVPCYTLNGTNVIMIGAFNDYCTLSFMKGALLVDGDNLLVKPGPNTQSSRILKFTEVQQVTAIETQIKAFVQEAIVNEKAGRKVKFKDFSDHEMPDELRFKLDSDPVFRSAFESLTPGRQRGYFLHFSSAKQPQTRINRIEKCVAKIMAGKGMQDR